MGGNALKEFGNIRLDKECYFELCDHLKTAFDGVDIRVIKSIRSKETFGDIDVLVIPEAQSPDKIDESFILSLHQRLYYNNPDIYAHVTGESIIIRNNGPVTTFGIQYQNGEIFQCDLILSNSQDCDFSESYFAWNDCGNLIGRIADKMGLKFCHDGLKMPVRNVNELLGTIVLTTDFKTALDFLMFDSELWSQGFDELDDMFDFIIDNPYFNPEIFLLENRNHTARMRDRKRVNYTKFLAYIQPNKNGRSYYEWNKNKGEYLIKIFSKFPDAYTNWNMLVEGCVFRNSVKEKFNGHVVKNITGLDGKELSQFMHDFSFYAGKITGDFWAFVQRVDQKDIENMIKFYQFSLKG